MMVGLVLSLMAFFVHILTASGYGYFRDELYFIAASHHLALGYVDFAPFVAWVIRFNSLVLGESLFALRFLPAVARSIQILLTALIIKELGGKRFAIIIGCLAVLIASGFLTVGSFMSMNVFEPLFWMGCAYFLILLVKRQNLKYWLPIGGLMGFGLLNKHSTIFFGAALIFGLLLTKQRRLMVNKWFCLGSVVAFLIFLPNIIWEYQNNWATLELLRNVQITGKNIPLSWWEFIGQQVILLLPITILLWPIGLWYFLFDRQGKQYKFLGFTFLFILILFIVFKGKSYYMLPVYPMLFAGGGVVWEKWLEQKKYDRLIKIIFAVLLVAVGVVAAPIALPVLPPETFLTYQKLIKFGLPKTEVGRNGLMPQLFGDRFGWGEMVESVAKVYESLNTDEQKKVVIFAANYGEAGAIDLFGPKYGLPRAISPHQNYYLWGHGDRKGEVIIVLGKTRTDLEPVCGLIEEAGEVGNKYSMEGEHFKIYICRNLKYSFWEFWPQLKLWN